MTPPHPPRILALDLGKIRIGVAVSDPLGLTAQPLETIQVQSIDEALARIREIAEANAVGTIVVGMPYNMDGTKGQQAQWVERISERLGRAMPAAAIVFWDERLTSSASESILIESGMRRRRRREHRDKLAAVLILQSYLESRRSRTS